MRKAFLILSILCFLTGCNNKKSTHQDTVTKYYKALEEGNYDEIKTVINDSLTTISGDFVTMYSPDSFYTFFKWDSVFKSSYRIIELEENNNQVIAKLEQRNVRNSFLEKNPLVYQVQVSFTTGKISKIKDLENLDEDWKVWAQKRDSLVSWVQKNHPELDGFVNDMTMNGAIEYVKAIELFEKSQLKE